MESKLNSKLIEQYTKDYCETISNEFFEQFPRVAGQQILNFAPLQQINLFIIKQLLENWRQETDKFNSPYFDYEKKEVKSALEQLNNELSHAISIDKENFLPLFEKAVRHTLLVIFSPYEFYLNQIKEQGETVKPAALQHVAKYFKINHHLFNAYLEKLKSTGKDAIPAKEALDQLQAVFAEFAGAPEEVEQYLPGFSETIPLDIEKIYQTESEEDENNLNASFTQDQETINDQLATSKGATLAESLGKSGASSIKAAITLNQRFMFVNELFEGRGEDFEIALSKLEEMPSKKDAFKFLDEQYSFPRKWDKTSTEVLELYKVVSKKFE